jgi:hypothetical protein
MLVNFAKGLQPTTSLQQPRTQSASFKIPSSSSSEDIISALLCTKGNSMRENIQASLARSLVSLSRPAFMLQLNFNLSITISK